MATNSKRRNTSYLHMRGGSHKTKKKDAADSSFLSTRGCGRHNKEIIGHGHCCRRGGRGGRDNTSQIHENAYL